MSPLVLWDDASQSWAEPGGATSPPVGEAPEITTTAIAPMIQGTPYLQTIAYTGDAATSASIIGAGAPSGIAPVVLAGVVTLAGTPSTPGEYTFTLRVQNALGSDEATYTVAVTEATEGYESRWVASDPVTHGSQITTSNTGVYPGIALTTYTGPLNITADDTVIENKTINGDVTVNALGVVFYNCVVNGYIAIDESAADFSRSFEAIDCTVNGGSRAITCIGTKNFTAIRCKVTGGNRSVYPYHYGEVIECHISGQWVSTTVRTHASAIRQSQNGLILRNNFRCDVEDVPGIGSGPSANLTGYGDFETVQNNTIEGNFIGWTHGGYGAYLGSSASKPFPNANNIKVRDNIWERGPSTRNGWYGPDTDYNPSAPGNEWINNRWDDGTVLNPS